MASLPASSDDVELRRLLVVDDEEIVLVALRETLARAGYEVYATSDAVEGLEALRRMSFATIITDQQMPRMTGLEFLAQAKVLRPDATRILITAVLNLSTVIEAINQGEIFRFIVKPWLRDDFLNAVGSAVVRYRRVSGNAYLRERVESEARQREVLEKRLDEVLTRTEALEREVGEARSAIAGARNSVRRLAYLMLSQHDLNRGVRTRNVANLCRAMAEAAGWPPEDREALEDAGWLHDVAASGATASECQGLPLRSAEMARGIGVADAVRLAIETHQERLDGSGYPARLRGDSVPRLGRWLGVAVAYWDGQAGHGHEGSLRRMGEGVGSLFDSEAVTYLEKGLAKLNP